MFNPWRLHQKIRKDYLNIRKFKVREEKRIRKAYWEANLSFFTLFEIILVKINILEASYNFVHIIVAVCLLGVAVMAALNQNEE